MDTNQLQSIETGLHKQAEATRSTNELIAQLFTIMSMLKANNVTICKGNPNSLGEQFSLKI
jgi:hypothetical protein